jgi:hypothetical protein
MAAIGCPIGTSYYRHGYWIYRVVFRRLLRTVLPNPLIETSAPVSAEVTITRQAATDARPERWMVHVVNFSPVRRSPEHCEYLKEPIPLRDIRVALRISAPVARAHTAADGVTLPLRRRDDGWEVTIPQVEHGTIVVFEVTSPL